MESLIIIALTLICSAFFSGMEIAFISANRLRIELDKKHGVSQSKVINIFANNPSQYLATMLIGNNIALVVYGMLMAQILEAPLSQYIHHSGLVVLVQTILSTLLILLIAEFLPKTLYKINPNQNLRIFAYPTYFFYLIFYPIARFTTFLSHLLIKGIFRVKIDEDISITFGKSDLNNLVNETQIEEDSDYEFDHDVKIFQNALDFSKIKLRDCVVPRTELVSVSIDDDVEKLRQKFIETGFTKILVYEDSIDNIIGYAHSIKLFERPQTIKSMVRRIPIVPETMPANKLLAMFTQNRKSMALVVDEFGGTAGIVTMEDIIEEIIGDIKDEHDKVDLIDHKISDDEYLFSGRCEISDLNEKHKLNLPESDDYVTIAGLVLTHHGSIPKVNDMVEVEGFSIKIIKATTTKVELVRLKTI